MSEHEDASAPAAADSRLELDSSQAAVVERALAGESFAAIGAPGSGRTATLIETVAAKVAQGTSPGRILAVAANRQLAARLRDRIAKRLDVAMPGGTLGRTMPSVALEIITADRAHRGEQPPRLLTGSMQDAILAEILEGASDEEGTSDRHRGAIAWPQWLDPDTPRLRGFRDELRSLISAMAEHDVSVEQLAAWATPATDEAAPAGQRHRALWAGAATVLGDYETVLDYGYDGVFDTPGAMQLATRLLARTGGERLPLADLELVVVDDAQELTGPARRMLRGFERLGAQVITFGDPDAATGAFHGGLAEHATNWRDAGEPQPQRLLLHAVHRHGPTLRGLVKGVSERIGVRGEHAHRSAPSARTDGRSNDAADLRRVPSAGSRLLASPSDEAEFVIGLLRRIHLTEGVPWGGFAVISRTGSRLPELTQAFDRAGVPTSASTPLAAADDSTVRAILDLGRAVVDEQLDAKTLERVLASPLVGIDPLGYRHLRRSAYFTQVAASFEADSAGAETAVAASPTGEPGADRAPLRSGADVLVDTVTAEIRGERDPIGSDLLDRLSDSKWRQPANAVRALIAAVRRMRARHLDGAPVDAVLYEAWRDDARAAEWQRIALSGGPGAAAMHRRLDALVALFDRGKRLIEREPNASLAGFLAEWERDSVVDDSLGARTALDAVTLTTPAGAVGKEWHTVVLVGLNEGVWPNLRVRDTLLGAGRLAEALHAAEPAPFIDRRREVRDDETRMLVAALSRAQERLVVTGIVNTETQASAFLRWLDLPEIPAEFALGAIEQLHYGELTLAGLAAELRRSLADDAERIGAGIGDAARARDERIAALARLAREGVREAQPNTWAGLRGRSTEAPLVEVDAEGALELSLSPSSVERFAECGVNWFVEAHAGGVSTAAQTVGTLIHAVAERIDEYADQIEMLADVDARVSALTFEATWQAEAQRQRIRDAALAIWQYCRGGKASTLAVESSFALRLEESMTALDDAAHGDASLEVEVGVSMRGRIDRIEVEAEQVRIVDFKTGTNTPKSDAELPQLAAYQLAWQLNAVEGLDTTDAALESALLLYPEVLQKAGAKQVVQPRLGPEELSLRSQALVETALGQAGLVVAGEAVAFTAPPMMFAAPDTHCNNQRMRHSCFIHNVPEVTA